MFFPLSEHYYILRPCLCAGNKEINKNAAIPRIIHTKTNAKRPEVSKKRKRLKKLAAAPA
jgi:hypothetical protein